VIEAPDGTPEWLFLPCPAFGPPCPTCTDARRRLRRHAAPAEPTPVQLEPARHRLGDDI
jgi:hypothetical protein